MNPSQAAILARCNGDVDKAAIYCFNVAAEHPSLTREYMEHWDYFRFHHQENKNATICA